MRVDGLIQYALNIGNLMNIKLYSFSNNVSRMQCNDNTLYVFVQHEQNGLKVYNIQNDPDQLNKAGEYVASANSRDAVSVIRADWKYYVFGGENAYIYAEKLDGTYQAAIIPAGNFLMTEQYIYYIQSSNQDKDISALWRYDSLHGKKQVGDFQQYDEAQLLNFDSNWIYFYNGNGVYPDNVYKIHWNGTDEQLVKKFPEIYIHLDVIGGWLYLYRDNGTVDRMKTNGSNYQTEPFLYTRLKGFPKGQAPLAHKLCLQSVVCYTQPTAARYCDMGYHRWAF